jgi:hypothetical protein
MEARTSGVLLLSSMDINDVLHRQRQKELHLNLTSQKPNRLQAVTQTCSLTYDFLGLLLYKYEAIKEGTYSGIN